MRILIASTHRYPSYPPTGTGLLRTDNPSGSSQHMLDLLAKGLGELGQDVIYYTRRGAAKPLPPGVRTVTGVTGDVDIYQNHADRDRDLIEIMEDSGVPWVSVCHRPRKPDGEAAPANWIFVSRTHAEAFGSQRFVWNGIDPADHIFRTGKEDYLLFVSRVEDAMGKGLDVALSVAASTGKQLVVAGGSVEQEPMDRMAAFCAASGATYVGDVRGHQKAELFANARALIFPAQEDEAFGLVIVEALMSGTPVIVGDRGACREIVSPDVGFICSHTENYVDAVEKVPAISPGDCRNKAINEFHYLRMAADYLKEYHAEISTKSTRSRKLKPSANTSASTFTPNSR